MLRSTVRAPWESTGDRVTSDDDGGGGRCAALGKCITISELSALGGYVAPANTHYSYFTGADADVDAKQAVALYPTASPEAGQGRAVCAASGSAATRAVEAT
ncbi:hypothetical protein CYMTET_12534 [Cymbomonas tetramitiformis]|uniref:Uncharacterized protein n=1 Tax=Cymbomonas tetramitiformis TaxID=36881 RepID=A0AAE0LCC1_9CHLO|nr:hypothetical protein CYMTET_12534 [Cymbomonas tetramitiformis]